MRSLRLLLLVLLIFTLQCVPAMAAAGDYDLTKAGEAYTLVYETADPIGTQVVLIMMTGSTLTDGKVPINASGDIAYINQTAVAAGTGTNKVTFSGFIPMDTTEDFFSLYLGGLTGGPTWVATVSASGIIVSGTVEYFGADNVTVNLYNSAKTEVVKTVTVSKASNVKDVAFAFSKVEPGTYYIRSGAKSYCVAEFKPITVLATDLLAANIAYKIYAGDVNNNGAINILDISALIDDFGKTEGLKYQGSDVNMNGSVNILDISALLDGFGKSN
ncbi:hypothetical protein MASR2M70_05710 [Bacillota bacterium]